MAITSDKAVLFDKQTGERLDKAFVTKEELNFASPG